VRRLVALNPVPATGVPFDEDGWALFSGAAASRDNRFAIINFTTGSRLPAAFVDHVVQHSLDHSTTQAFGAYLESWGKTDFSERVKGNPAAVKVIVGEHDPALGAPVMEQTWLQFYPAAELEVIPNAGHYPMFETPAALAASIEEFLDRD
jgi:pimeloyl-ACP methyl ester carboxylesterase